MILEILEKPEGVAQITVSGKADKSDFDEIGSFASKLAAKYGSTKVLIILVEFEGWSDDEVFQDMKHIEEADQRTAKMAVIGHDDWREQVEMFLLKGMRPFPIHYFSLNQHKQALEWLQNDKYQD